MSSMIKGTGTIGYKKSMDAISGSGYFDKKMKELNPNWDGFILSSSWYNALVLANVNYLAAKEKGENRKEFCIKLAEKNLENDMNGVYKFFIKLGGPEKVLSYFPQIASAYTNFQKETIITNKKGFFKGVVELPSDIEEFMIYSHEGAFKGILKVCGYPMKSFTVISSEKIMKNDIDFTLLTFEVIY